MERTRTIIIEDRVYKLTQNEFTDLLVFNQAHKDDGSVISDFLDNQTYEFIGHVDFHFQL
jgi:hypothetical protein